MNINGCKKNKYYYKKCNNNIYSKNINNCCNNNFNNNFNNKFNNKFNSSLNSLFEVENFLCNLRKVCKCLNLYKFLK